MERRENIHRSYFELELFRHGNKPGRLLANLAKGKTPRTHVSALKHPQGRILTDPRGINAVFRDFYQNLYTEQSPVGSGEEGLTFLRKVRLPKASEEMLTRLNAEITDAEICSTIRKLGCGKAPGPDGYTGEFYKLMRDQLSPVLARYFNVLLDTGELRPEADNAYILVLPKPGRDPLDPGSYRPISLLDQDLKILSKILADRLANFLPQLIGPSQVGFVKNRSAVCNIRKVMAVLDQIKVRPPTSGCPTLLALDAEKAFDHVKWQWLYQVLDTVGIKGKFRNYLSGIYSHPTAQVHTAGYLSAPIYLQKGTRQGCPLSPLLFDLALEPLIRYLEDSDLFSGISIGRAEIKVTAFADDVLLFLSHPDEHLSPIFRTLTEYGRFSGYSINITKSELLLLGSGGRHAQRPVLDVPVRVATHFLTYLGIKIGRTPETIYSLNYPPLFGRILDDLHRWVHLPLSLMGRCHLVRMMGFYRLLYPMQTIPLLLKHRDVRDLQSAFVKFIWAGKRPRIALNKLMMSKEEGGINFPSLRGYNLACLMRHVLDWLHRTKCFSNWEIESNLAAPWPLASLIHTRYSNLPPHVKQSVTLRDTIITWKETRLWPPLPSFQIYALVGTPRVLPR